MYAVPDGRGNGWIPSLSILLGKSGQALLSVSLFPAGLVKKPLRDGRTDSDGRGQSVVSAVSVRQKKKEDISELGGEVAAENC